MRIIGGRLRGQALAGPGTATGLRPTADRVRAVVAPILAAWPGLRFSLAQSVEPELPATESHFTAGRAEFARRMTALAATFDQANFTGIVVQDWTRWQEMQP